MEPSVINVKTVGRMVDDYLIVGMPDATDVVPGYKYYQLPGTWYLYQVHVQVYMHTYLSGSPSFPPSIHPRFKKQDTKIRVPGMAPGMCTRYTTTCSNTFEHLPIQKFSRYLQFDPRTGQTTKFSRFLPLTNST